jgi:hypothetical protein
LTLIWANAHSGFVVGLGVLGAYAVEELVRRRRPGTRTAVALAAGVIALANPHTWRAYAYPFALIARSDVYQLTELAPPAFPAAAHALVLGLVAAAWLARGRVRLADLMIAAAGASIGLTRSRGVMEAAILGAPVLALGIDTLAAKLRIPHDSRWATAACGVLAACALLAFGVRPSLSVRESMIPRAAMEFVEREALSGEMYNSHVIGAWILWAHPERKVFIDGRNEIYSDLFDEVRSTSVPTLAERYDLGYAVPSYPWDRPTRADFAEAFFQLPDWWPVYFDDTARVFVRQRPEHRHVIAHRAYRVLRPGARDLSYFDACAAQPECRSVLGAEVRRASADAPDTWIARLYLAEWYRVTNRYEDALQTYRGLTPKDDFVWGRIGAIALVLQDYASSVAALKDAVALAPEDVTYWTNLGMAYLESRRPALAISPLERAVALDPELAVARDLLERARGEAARAR